MRYIKYFKESKKTTILETGIESFVYLLDDGFELTVDDRGNGIYLIGIQLSTYENGVRNRFKYEVVEDSLIKLITILEEDFLIEPLFIGYGWSHVIREISDVINSEVNFNIDIEWIEIKISDK